MTRPAQYFRAGAGAVIINAQGLVLVLERADVPGAWQLPQGGLDAAEEPVQAIFREVAEETGVGQRDLELLEAYPGLLCYELPTEMRSEKTGRGQAQYWYLFRFQGDADGIDVASGGEFRAWRWIAFDEILAACADFRRPVYLALADRFRRFLRSG